MTRSDIAHLDLVGSSWGALIALTYAARHPERVRRLVLVDVEPSFEQGETDLLPRPRAYDSYQEVLAYERRNNPHGPDAMIEVMARMGTRPSERGGYMPKHDPFFFEKWPFRSDDHWGELPQVEPRTLVVHAGKSFVRRPSSRRWQPCFRMDHWWRSRNQATWCRSTLPTPSATSSRRSSRRENGRATKEAMWARLRGEWRSSPVERRESVVPTASGSWPRERVLSSRT